MHVKILGPMTQDAQKLLNNTALALKKLKTKATFETVNDVRQAIAYGVLAIPALVIDDKVLSAGSILSVEEVMRLIEQSL